MRTPESFFPAEETLPSFFQLLVWISQLESVDTAEKELKNNKIAKFEGDFLKQEEKYNSGKSQNFTDFVW